MSRKKPEFTTTVTIRLTEQDKKDLTRLCDALDVTKSEFLREKVSNINNYIMSKTTADLFNIPPAPATDAWGRKIAEEKSKKVQSDKLFGEKLNSEFNSKLTAKHGNVSAIDEGETPFSTPEGILVQLRNAKDETKNR